jgi:hypothetical protein
VGGDEGDVGLTATAALGAGETLISVPSALLLTPSSCWASAAGARIRAAADAAALPEPPTRQAVFIVSYCIGLADSGDPFHWYFRTLPQRDPTTLSWPLPVRASLAGSSLGDATDRAEQQCATRQMRLRRRSLPRGSVRPPL